MGSWLALLLLAAPGQVFVDAAEAEALIRAGAQVVDARDAPPPYLPGAQRLDWMRLRDGPGRTGRLAPEPELRAKVGALGLSPARPILVYADAGAGFGEEGRIWWTLRYLGYPRVLILDGGLAAWRRAGLPTATSLAGPSSQGRPPVTPLQARLRVDTDAVRAAQGEGLLDVRGPEEFRGQTPFGSPRGGHIPGARNLPWTRLLRPDGTLRPRAELERILGAAGVSRGAPIITYCTGGVRSAFVQAVLHHLGYPEVANYDGSWWAWSADPSAPVAR